MKYKILGSFKLKNRIFKYRNLYIFYKWYFDKKTSNVLKKKLFWTRFYKLKYENWIVEVKFSKNTIRKFNFKNNVHNVQSSLIYFKSRVFQVSRSLPHPTISLSREALRSARKKWEEWGEVHSVDMATEAVVGTPRDLK